MQTRAEFQDLSSKYRSALEEDKLFKGSQLFKELNWMSERTQLLRDLEVFKVE